MNTSQENLLPTDAAARLGVSTKALRLYEARGLLTPVRTAAGWRTYGAAEMARAGEIVALRSLGLSLAETERVLNGESETLQSVLATHQAALENKIHDLTGTVNALRGVRSSIAQGDVPSVRALTNLIRPEREIQAAFDLPWPWGGERFELRNIGTLNYIVGPLFSGKTRFAKALATALPDAVFLGLDRLSEITDGVEKSQDTAYSELLQWLLEEGATGSKALTSLARALAATEPEILIIDMIEAELDQASQEALIAYLRHRRPDTRPLFLMTRSNAILDLTALGTDETIILCPANHSPPTIVAPYPGAPGYETVLSCLAAPAVRDRTKGVVAIRPQAAER